MSKPQLVFLGVVDPLVHELLTKLQPHAEPKVVPSVEAALAAVVDAPTRLIVIGAGDHTFVHSNQLMRALGSKPRPLVILLRHTWEPDLVQAQQRMALRADGYLATGFGADLLVGQLVQCLNPPESAPNT